MVDPSSPQSADSGTLIAQMKEKHAASRPGMDWLEMDIRDLKFDAGSFDVALDKGTMECVLLSAGLVAPVRRCGSKVPRS